MACWQHLWTLTLNIPPVFIGLKHIFHARSWQRNQKGSNITEWSRNRKGDFKWTLKKMSGHSRLVGWFSRIRDWSSWLPTATAHKTMGMEKRGRCDFCLVSSLPTSLTCTLHSCCYASLHPSNAEFFNTTENGYLVPKEVTEMWTTWHQRCPGAPA